MDLTPELQLLIEEYLAGRLKGTALHAFEEQLANNEVLAKEVEFQRELTTFLADSPENDLRKNLQQLNEQVELPKDRGTSWKLGLFLLPFFFIGTWWWFNRPMNEITKPLPDTPKGTTSTEPSERGVLEPSITLDTNGIANPVKATSKTKTTFTPVSKLPEPTALPAFDSIGSEPGREPTEKELPKSTLPADSVKGPIAGELSSPEKESVILPNNEPLAAPPPTGLMAFEPNEALALLMAKNNINDSFRLTTNNWRTDFEIATLTDSIAITWSDSLTSQIALLEKNVQVHLFSNDITQFQNFSSLASHTLPLQQLSSTTYQLTFQQKYLLNPGRYYFVIQDAAQMTTYHVQEFFVRKAED